jgi:hypothetical protein
MHLFTLKLESGCSSETSVDFQYATRRYIPEDRNPHNHSCENLKFYKIICLFNEISDLAILLHILRWVYNLVNL